MKKNFMILLCFAVAGCFFSITAIAGDLDSPAGPGVAGSAMYTLEDVYNRLDTGAAGAKRTGAFTEPTAGPGPTGHTTDDIMDVAPAVDDTNGAVAAEVAPGKTFWGLTNGEWGPRTGTATVTPSCTGDATTGDVLSGKTFSNGTAAGVIGTMPNIGAQNISPGASPQGITAGYHDGTGEVAGDADLLAGNIVDGKELFGVSGTAIVATGTATDAQVLNGMSYSNVSGASSGTMPNNGAVAYDPAATDVSIANGYHNGSKVNGDADLVAGNIVNGTEIFGVTGTASVATGNALIDQVLSGQTFSNSVNSGLTGTMPNIGAQNITPGTSPQGITAGYHDGTGEVAGDADLVAGKIINGVQIFGVTGTAIVATGTATDAQVRDGVSYSNSGGASTGTMRTRTLSPDNDTVNAGYYGATTLSTVDTDLATGNIRSGVTVFGVAGDPNVVNTSSGDAVSADIVSGKIAWVDGTEVTGTASLGATYSAGVPKTGQTTSYATGDDGDLEKGVALPNPRFSDNSDGTVTDNLTGLIWLKNANADGVKTWEGALTWCNSLANGTAGLTDGSAAGDWRLPNVKELQSLVDFGNIGPPLPSGHPFTNVQTEYYWSGTTYIHMTDWAWFVHMLAGGVIIEVKSDKHYVWPVRGGND